MFTVLAHLEISGGGSVGHVRIQGMLTNMFVAMDKKGRLYPEVTIKAVIYIKLYFYQLQPNRWEEGTVFIELIKGLYNVYLSKKYSHLGWYLGIKKNGKFKRGPKTAWKQKAIQFLPRRGKFQ